MAEYACVVCCVGVACIGGFQLLGVSIGEDGSMGYAVCRVEHLLDDEDFVCGDAEPDGSPEGGTDSPGPDFSGVYGDWLRNYAENGFRKDTDKDTDKNANTKPIRFASADTVLNDATVFGGEPTDGTSSTGLHLASAFRR